MNRLARPILFAMEPDVVLLYARVSFGAAGAPTLDTSNSKGFCNITRNAIAITGTSSNASTSVTSVNTFAGLYNGMTITGTNIAASTTIASMNPGAGTITLSQNATGANAGLTVGGGQYTLQLGSKAGVNLDTYTKLLRVGHIWDISGLQGGASTGASAPAAPAMFLMGNKVKIRTVPPTVAGNLTDATIQVQFGTGAGSSFVAADPASGEVVLLELHLSRSSAI